MLKTINLKNFRSFGNLEANFTKSSGIPKKLIMIYGENGSGKSNLISSILFLKKTLNTLSVLDNFDKLMESDESENYDGYRVNTIFSFARTFLSKQIKENKMIDSDENMVLEFHYVYHTSKEAIYKMEFDDTKIVYESFHCQLEKNMVKVYEISNDNTYFNNNLFMTEKYENEIKEKVLKYFGKHTFLAIINNERFINNVKYIKQNISKSFLEAIDELVDCSVWSKQQKNENELIDTSQLMLNLSHGSISIKDKKLLLNTEEALSYYFTCLYSDIKSVHYEFDEDNKRIKYNLYFDKIISGKIRSIPYYLESTGTDKLLKIFPYIYKCLKKGTVFIDEIDSGIHDILMNYLLLNLEKQIKGQLIITTHNTMLLQKINPDYSYVINVDLNGNKTLNCVKDYGRIQNNHNVSTRYLNGIFGGIPQPGHIDLQEIVLSIDNRK